MSGEGSITFMVNDAIYKAIRSDGKDEKFGFLTLDRSKSRGKSLVDVGVHYQQDGGKSSFWGNDDTPGNALARFEFSGSHLVNVFPYDASGVRLSCDKLVYDFGNPNSRADLIA